MIAKSLIRSVQRVARAAGIEIHRYPRNPWNWSDSVEHFYPVTPLPRWGYGKPVHPQISYILNSRREDILSFLDQIALYGKILEGVSLEGDPNSATPYWNNPSFGYLDAAVLITMVAANKPTRYFEIGSGNSTKFARYTINSARLSTHIISLDPHPHVQIDQICDTVIRGRLEDCDLSLFDQLQAGDILFFDGSHRAFTNSDVTVFFLEIIPRLKSGVIIHIHDIFLPSDYPLDWEKRMYSEQYMLAAMLLCPTQPFKVLVPNFFISEDAELRKRVPPFADLIGSSFWIKIAQSTPEK